MWLAVDLAFHKFQRALGATRIHKPQGTATSARRARVRCFTKFVQTISTYLYFYFLSSLDITFLFIDICWSLDGKKRTSQGPESSGPGSLLLTFLHIELQKAMRNDETANSTEVHVLAAKSLPFTTLWLSRIARLKSLIGLGLTRARDFKNRFGDRISGTGFRDRISGTGKQTGFRNRISESRNRYLSLNQSLLNFEICSVHLYISLLLTFCLHLTLPSFLST